MYFPSPNPTLPMLPTLSQSLDLYQVRRNYFKAEKGQKYWKWLPHTNSMMGITWTH